ncbi:hypothetical protein [Swaminathania salitolerans]|uniref:Uncharacterized protein n=1 Tax=Swaminathania salitolerans TaxID=182838 RepID=A0A511BMG4_9PROT|nr:hypothetical protein [Swaminathania salitolerans]GBQ10363.1 hypothetical protein AA21291_0403 [Swaminathania salitolerans LMG 21291]GEL01262.1 hypothetical protein SSA02_04250 [Swaminathania salitolerans]
MTVTTGIVSSFRVALTDLTGLALAIWWGYRGLSVTGLDAIRIAALLAAPGLALAYGFLSRAPCSTRGAIGAGRERSLRRLRIPLLFLLGFALHCLHRSDLMLPAAGLAIGASFFLPGRTKRDPIHVIAGCGIIGLTLLALGLTDPLRSLVAGLGTALCLWLTAAIRLLTERPERCTIPASARIASASNIGT